MLTAEHRNTSNNAPFARCDNGFRAFVCRHTGSECYDQENVSAQKGSP